MTKVVAGVDVLESAWINPFPRGEEQDKVIVEVIVFSLRGPSQGQAEWIWVQWGERVCVWGGDWEGACGFAAHLLL